MFFIDIKYLNYISSRLRNFKQKNTDVWNCSCSFCGDSKRNALKARGYFFKANNHPGLSYKCYNCNISTSFGSFLKFIDPVKHREYIMEKFAKPNYTEQIVEQKVAIEPELKNLTDIDTIPSMMDLSYKHYVRQYIDARKIPKVFYPEIFFAEDYKKFLDETFPNHGKDNLIENDPRIVLFYTNMQGQITNVSGRTLSASQKVRYISVKVSDQRKIFGLHRVDLNEKIYVVEGQFDSFFLPNAIASGDANLASTGEWMKDTFGVEPVLVFDREPRNPQIVHMIEKAIAAGWDVVLLPEHFIHKDINDAIKAGMTAPMIHMAVDKYTFSGLTAELELIKWRKC